jgi:hypothetical protein
VVDSVYPAGSVRLASASFTPRVRPSAILVARPFSTSFRMPSRPGAFPSGSFYRTSWTSVLVIGSLAISIRVSCGPLTSSISV